MQLIKTYFFHLPNPNPAWRGDHRAVPGLTLTLTLTLTQGVADNTTNPNPNTFHLPNPNPNPNPGHLAQHRAEQCEGFDGHVAHTILRVEKAIPEAPDL